MEYPVVLEGKTVGSCVIEDQGLYWWLLCSCQRVSNRVERLYCGKKSVGVLLLEEDRLVLRRRLSKTSMPEFPPVSGVFSLRALSEAVSWSGTVLGYHLEGIRLDDILLFPYFADQPCPCEPLFCFFAIEDGFWKLDLNKLCPVQS